MSFPIHAADASQNQKAPPETPTLLLEIRDIPASQREPGGRFANDEFGAKRRISLIRDTALLIATPEENEALRRDGFSPTIVMKSDNVLDLYKRGIYGAEMKLPACYHTYERVLSEAAAYEKKYPDKFARLCIGETMGMRHPIHAWRISAEARPPRDKPALLFEAAIHADELLGTEIVCAFFKKLVDGLDNKDAQTTRWLADFDIYLIPVLNVDGHNIVTTGRDPRWRKNLRDVNGDGITGIFPKGVDLNRGFDFNWALAIARKYCPLSRCGKASGHRLKCA